MVRYFVVPPLHGPLTGGTLYNRELVRALRRTHETARVLEMAPSARESSSALEEAFADGAWVWVDSLFLEHLPMLREKLGGDARVGLLAHYLPSLVARALGRPASALEKMEDQAHRVVDMVVAPSAFLRDCSLRAGINPQRAKVIEPGRFARKPAREISRKEGLRAALIANLTPAKGVEALLSALRAAACEQDAFSLSIVGSAELDPAYARACRELVDRSSVLARRVVFEGALSPEQCVLHLAERNLLVSSSVMESYGMALSEARTLGVPLLARAGGNASSHVDEAAGGELVNDAASLVQALLRLSRDQREHELRIERAQRHAYPARSFEGVAKELVACERESNSSA